MVSAAFKQYLELVGTTQGIYSKTFDGARLGPHCAAAGAGGTAASHTAQPPRPAARTDPPCPSTHLRPLPHCAAVPFNNGTATADLNAFFATPDPGAQLPLMVFILGTDTPKESM